MTENSTLEWLIEYHASACGIFQQMAVANEDPTLLGVVEAHKIATEYLVNLKKAGLELMEERKQRKGRG